MRLADKERLRHRKHLLRHARPMPRVRIYLAQRTPRRQRKSHYFTTIINTTVKIKIIPFDFETAKKIQAGDIEGNIRTERGQKVLLYKNDSIVFKCFIHECRDGIHIAYNNSEVFNLLKLYLEVPDNEPQFKPFNRVLVRDNDTEQWRADFFSHMHNGWYVCGGARWRYCIPYEGYEHLVGTTDKPKEE